MLKVVALRTKRRPKRVIVIYAELYASILRDYASLRNDKIGEYNSISYLVAQSAAVPEVRDCSVY